MMSNDHKVTKSKTVPSWCGQRSMRGIRTRLGAGGTARYAAISDQLPSDRYLNRELSWLDFNAYACTGADKSIPLLGNAKFLAIFASNLDEFYMVRWPLKREMGLSVRSADGLTPREQLGRIGGQTQQLASRRRQCSSIRCPRSLRGICIVTWADLDRS